MRIALLLLFSLPAFAFDPAGLERLRLTLDIAVAADQPRGLVLLAEHGNDTQSVVLGARDENSAMTKDTIFDVASLTKVVATTPSIHLLAQRGLIDLAAPVQRYVKEYPHPNITLAHLLTHTSGLPAGIPRDADHPDWEGYAEGIRRAVACKPDPSPGTAFRYSDVNFILLGEIVKRVSSRPLDQFARDEVFKPLGMNDTGYTRAKDLLPRIAPTEKSPDGIMLRGVVHDPTARRMGGVAGHAGLFSSAKDLAAYARAIMRGHALFTAMSLAHMREVRTPSTLPEQRSFGFDIASKFSRPRGRLFPIGSFGHTGFTGTALWMDRSSDTFFVFLSSRLWPDGKGNVRELTEQIGTKLAQALPQHDFTAQPSLGDDLVLNGIDVLERSRFAPLKGLRIGLITNHTGRNLTGKPTIDLLHKVPGVKLVRLFSPEHGIRGELDQEKINDSIDKATGLPVISLYGDNRAPKAEQLSDLDALVFDIQDIGTRFYTYIATMRHSLEAAAKAKKRFIVLDRLNPLRANVSEGPCMVPVPTFTSCHPISLRHGMTTGELATMMNVESSLAAKLTVVEITGWDRTKWLDQTKVPWRNPSPNMRSLTAATLYPGIGLLEFAISVGRGTDAPFEVIGAPYIDSAKLAREIEALALPGLRVEATTFTPKASVFKDKPCQGLKLTITDRDALRPVHAGLTIAHTLHRLWPKDFDLAKLNTLLQHGATITALQQGRSLASIAAMWEAEAQSFSLRRQRFLLYP